MFGKGWRRSARGRRLIGIAVLSVPLATMLGAGSSRAETCVFDPLVGCPRAPVPPTSTTTVVPPSTTTTTAPPPTTTTVPSDDGVIARMLELLNGARADAGLPPLVSHHVIGDVAQRWSGSMAAARRLAHNDDYFTPDMRQRLGARALGENVARAGDVDAAHRALMDSAPHRANILDPRFTDVGIGTAFAEGQWWFTQDFAQLTHAAPIADADGERARALPPSSDGGDEAEMRVVSASAQPARAGSSQVVALPVRPRSDRSLRLLPGEAEGERRLVLVAVALALPPVVIAAALRRRARQLLADADDTVEDDTEVLAVGGELHQQLALAVTWVRTLEERWASLSDGDRRVALQSIRRNVERAAVLTRA